MLNKIFDFLNFPNRTGTNSDQFEILVSFMEQNEGIAKNFLNSLQYKETTNMKWNEVMERLNAAGPPEKTVDGWKKVRFL